MKRLAETTWAVVFDHWRISEASNPDWIYTATKVKGWPDWESWRMFTANQLKFPQRTWAVDEFTDPMNEIPALLVGPYSGWQSRLPKPNACTFAELVNIKKNYQDFAPRASTQRLISRFPADALLTGLRKSDGAIVLLEGHHRATAVAIAEHDKMMVNFSGPVQIALADFDQADDDLLDRVLARGSEKSSFTSKSKS